MFSEEHESCMDCFIQNSERLLVAYMDPIAGLKVGHSVPSHPVWELVFFIKGENAGEITEENFLIKVQYGTVTGGHIKSLLSLMTGIYAPIFFGNTSWPDSILFLKKSWLRASFFVKQSCFIYPVYIFIQIDILNYQREQVKLYFFKNCLNYMKFKLLTPSFLSQISDQ